MNVVYFIDNLRGDGSQRVLTLVVQRLAKRGYKQRIVCLNDSWDENLMATLRKSDIEVWILGKAGLVGGYKLLQLWWWLRQENFDVAVTMLFFSDIIGRVIARLAAVPRIISSLRARNVHYSVLQRQLVRATMPLADAVVINSAHFREFAITTEGVSPTRLFVIPNGVCANKFAGRIDQTKLRRELGLPSGRKLIGTVGRLTNQKGFDVLLHAGAILQEDDFEFIIVGTGEAEPRLRSLAADLNLQSRVHFLGYRRDIPALLGNFDVYVQPSRFEGMPNSLLEAMAAACPIVASSVDGISELIEDGVAGWLIPPDDPTLLAAAIRDVLDHSEEAHRRANAARQTVLDNYSVDAMVSAWEQLFVQDLEHMTQRNQ
jgi:glycosyltransferase involved in cell wall biosynthesis